MKIKGKKIIFGALAALIVITTAVRLMNNRSRIVSQTDEISTDKVSVSVADVEKKTSSFTLEFTGAAYPYKELDIAAETQGKITSLNFELGQYFERDEELAVIDDKISSLNYASARINAEQLKKEYERVEKLYKNDLTSEQEYDNARTSYETAQNSLDEAEKQLSYTKAMTSISGVITDKYIEEGTYVNSGDIIASIVDISRLKVKLNASESNAYYLKVGDSVDITADIYPGAIFRGAITFVSPRGDESHSYPVEIEMVNDAKRPLKAGAFVNVSATISSSSEALYIPREALQGSVKEAKVYVVEDGKARLRQLVVGRESNGSLEVISGLKETDKVVVSGQVNLSDGRSVKIVANK